MAVTNYSCEEMSAEKLIEKNAAGKHQKRQTRAICQHKMAADDMTRIAAEMATGKNCCGKATETCCEQIATEMAAESTAEMAAENCCEQIAAEMAA